MKQESQFRALLDAAPYALLSVSEAGLINWVNDPVEIMFGYPRAELLGRSIDLLIPDVAPALHQGRGEQQLGQPATQAMGTGIELAGRRKDGSEFPAEVSLSAISTAEGLLLSAAVRDLTDQNRAESKFQGLLEAAPDAILGVDIHGVVVLANGQAERLFGYPRHELVGHPIDQLVPEAARGMHPRRRQAYLQDPQHRPMGAGIELAGRRKDGSEFPAEISLSAIETEDGVIISAAVRDVSERIEAAAERERLRAMEVRERLEGQLHQSQRLESLGQLAGGVAHDFNNLLAVILNYAYFVAEEVDSALATDGPERWEAVRGDIEQIRRAAERATELTHQLLAFGRREVVRPQTLNLNDVVTGIEPLLRRTLGEHIDLFVQLTGDLAPVTIDPGQLEQVLVNLAVNARDAMPGGGSLTVATRNVRVDEAYLGGHLTAVPGEFVRLDVRDSGSGMGTDVLPHVFEPFFTTKPKGEGSGLGLATVYGIVKQAGGDVQLYSELGLGTTVGVLLPVAVGGVVTTEPGTDLAYRGGSETILLVEDEAAMREVGRRILSRRGYHVLTADGGVDALRLAREHEGAIELLLTDVIMPTIQGKELSDRVRHLRPAIRVLFMSGYAQPVLASTGRLDADVNLVEKPFSEATLLGAIRDVLDEAAP